MAMSFGKENIEHQEPSATYHDQQIGDLVFEMEGNVKRCDLDNSNRDKQSPESNVTPYFNSVTPSESPEKGIKFSWQETPPEERLQANFNMQGNLNDSFCEQQKKLDLLEEQRKHLYEERQRSVVLMPYKFQEGTVALLSDKYESVNLPWQLWQFRAGETVIMTVKYEEGNKLGQCDMDLQRALLEQDSEECFSNAEEPMA